MYFANLKLHIYYIPRFHIFQEFNDWVVKYVTLNKNVIKLKDRVELNLMLLDVSEVNTNLKKIIKSLKHRILDYYMDLTQRSIAG